MLRVFYTGDLIVPDGSDSFDDMPCEEGTGATVSHGWVDPDWSLGEVRDERDEVTPDEWTPDDGPMIDWIIDRIGERLGWVADPEPQGSGGTFYAAEATGPWDACYTGVSLRLAAHAEGATPEIMRAVSHALRHAQRPQHV